MKFPTARHKKRRFAAGNFCVRQVGGIRKDCLAQSKRQDYNEAQKI